MDWKAVIDAAHKATNEHGIAVRGGRKYLQVAQRVEMLRLHFGDYGVETQLLHFGQTKGDSIVVRAVISNPEGRTIATGIAEEIRGNGNVNTTSAVENAETSAIGRALAALGLHGGEFASLNEVERATDPHAIENARQAQEPKAKPEARDPRKIADALIAAVKKRTTTEQIDDMLETQGFGEPFQWLKSADEPKYNEVRTAIAKRRDEVAVDMPPGFEGDGP